MAGKIMAGKCLFQVLLAAKLGFKSSGIKLNYWMLPYSRIQAWSQREEKNVSFYRKDILKVTGYCNQACTDPELGTGVQTPMENDKIYRLPYNRN